MSSIDYVIPTGKAIYIGLGLNSHHDEISLGGSGNDLFIVHV
jgi:hypothetical protein